MSPSRGRLNTIAGVLIVVASAFGSGCARTDWIERTLVTVDVTGTWSGNVGGAGGGGGTLWFELEQQGSTVKGDMQYVGGLRGFGLPSTSRPIDGTVAGDVFRFRPQNSTVEGELTVSGDEMTGQVWSGAGLRPIFLRRADPSSRPPR
jgi:hypothetical protein